MKKNTHFLKLKFQHQANDHIEYDKILSYHSGKLTPIVNLMSHRKGAWNDRHNSYIKDVGSDFIQIRMQSMPPGVGAIQYRMTYKLVNGTLKLTSSTFPVTYAGSINRLLDGENRWTPLRSLAVYDNVYCDDHIYTIRKYSDVRITKIRFFSGRAYIYVVERDSDSDAEGWVLCPGKFGNMMFEQSWFI